MIHIIRVHYAVHSCVHLYFHFSVAMHDISPVTAQANVDLKCVKDFKVALRHAQHAAIFECFRAFNRKGGAIVPLQTGGEIYFARSCILTIFADHPAARKCTLTGSACPICYTPQNRMDLAEQEPQHALYRTEETMKRRKRIYTAMSRSGARAANETATNRAKRVGVNILFDNAWYDGDCGQDEKVFGPCLLRDNIYQICPQPNLHGMDEGLTQKTNLGVLEATILEAKRLHNLDATEVRPLTAACVHHRVHNVHCEERYNVLCKERYNVHYNVHYTIHCKEHYNVHHNKHLLRPPLPVHRYVDWSTSSRARWPGGQVRTKMSS